MPFTREEVRVSLGIDSRTLDSGLRGARGKIENWGKSLHSTFAGIGAKLTAAFSVGVALDQLKRLSDYVEGIKRTAETTGLSTDFAQDLTNIAKSSGIAAANVESLVQKFASKLQPGSDPEKALGELADRMKGISDPATLATMATDAFGEAGVKLIPVLSQGSEALKKLGDEYGRVSEVQIAIIDNANEVLDKWGTKSKVTIATMIQSLAMLGKGFKNLPSQGLAAFQGALADQLFTGPTAEQKDQQKIAADAVKHAQMIQDGLKAQTDYEEHLRKIEYDRADTSKKILMDTEALLKARRQLAEMGDKPEAERYKKLIEIADIEQQIYKLKQKQAEAAPKSNGERTDAQKRLDAANAKVYDAAKIHDRYDNDTTRANLQNAVRERNGVYAQIQAEQKQSQAIDPRQTIAQSVTDRMLNPAIPLPQQQALGMGSPLAAQMNRIGMEDSKDSKASVRDQLSEKVLEALLDVIQKDGIIVNLNRIYGNEQ